MSPRRCMIPALSFAVTVVAAASLSAQTVTNVQYVNGLAVPGNTEGLAGLNSTYNRLGMFSDIYYDRNRDEWWGVADRGPGGGVLSYDTRIERFTLTVNGTTGAISNFAVAQTVLLKSAGVPLNGLAPNPVGTLGNSLDPEGLVVNPLTGNFLISDEYGPSVLEFDRSGNLLRRFAVPTNLIPKVGSNTNYTALPVPANSGDPTLTAGRELNRGFEGLAISPDGRFAYAMLQNGTIGDGYNTSTGTRGLYTRIVKYDIASGVEAGQYAYRLESSGQGRGISALVALGNDKFLVLERNNRGVGVGATLSGADKNVFEIDLSPATDITAVNLPASGNLPPGRIPVTKVASKIIDLDQNTLAALGNKAPEKLEGLAIGPKLANGRYMILTGTDNDFSVTQNGMGTQFDVYFDFTKSDPYAASIQCPIGSTVGCFTTATANNAIPTGADPAGYALLPGVLQSYSADINGFVPVVTPEPATLVLLVSGLGLVGLVARRRSHASR